LLLDAKAGDATGNVVRSVKQIQAAPAGQASFHDKRLLVRALSAMAKRVIDDASLLESLLCDAEHRENDIYYRAGWYEGKAQALREAIVISLAACFGSLPEDLRARLDAVDGHKQLDRLVAAAARAWSFDGFRGEWGEPPGARG
jgi:hypothetical protein